MPSSRSHTGALAAVALMAAVLTLCAWITIPLGPVPFTMQNFGLFAALGLLGGRRGSLSVAVYLLLGLVGLPVFSGFGAGPGALLGPTGGFLLGFLLCALVYWAVTARRTPSPKGMALGMGLGLLACYALGAFWLVAVYTGGGQHTLGTVLALYVLPYVVPDLMKLALALVLVRRVGPHLPAHLRHG